MNKKQRQIITNQATLATKLSQAIKVDRGWVQYGDRMYKSHCAHNNRMFNPIRGIVPALTVGKRAALIRFLIREESVVSPHTLMKWVNISTVKQNTRQFLVDSGRLQVYSN